MNTRELLIDTHSHLAPAAVLANLTPEHACRRPAHAPHSIAEIVAHMAYWQTWFTARIDGRAEPIARSARIGWPAVGEDDWLATRTQFLAGSDELVRAASRHDLSLPVDPVIETPMMAAYTYRHVCEHVALHNAHHLGQVVLLRQLMGLWPPPEGGYTW
ncbi:MAG: DinB family protein [Gemmatimonadaceae bacterium]|nr:DinB family protein [Gemmatimonadaceae bacterium]